MFLFGIHFDDDVPSNATIFIHFRYLQTLISFILYIYKPISLTLNAYKP